MEQKVKPRLTLWMRDVNFDKVKDILFLVSNYNGKLRAMQLEQLAIEKGILTKEDGSPMAHSPRYHYRKVMENLGIISKSQNYYYVSRSDKVNRLLAISNFKEPLSEEGKEIVADIIVSNRDCRQYFFDIFMDNSGYDLAALREAGNWVLVRTKGKEGTVLENPRTSKSVTLETADKMHAIFWGVRLWALDLAITDEIFESYKEGRIIYPVVKNVAVFKILSSAIKFIAQARGNGQWIMVHVPDLIREIALNLKVLVKEVKQVIHRLEKEFPKFVVLVPSSSTFISIKTPFERQDPILFKSYLRDEEGRFISHLKIHRNLLEKLLEKGGKL